MFNAKSLIRKHLCWKKCHTQRNQVRKQSKTPFHFHFSNLSNKGFMIDHWMLLRPPPAFSHSSLFTVVFWISTLEVVWMLLLVIRDWKKKEVSLKEKPNKLRLHNFIYWKILKSHLVRIYCVGCPCPNIFTRAQPDTNGFNFFLSRFQRGLYILEPVIWVYSRYGKYSDNVKFFTSNFCYIAAIC